MLNIRSKFLVGTFLSSLTIFAAPSITIAEDCTGVFPAADCTLDEDTNSPLTIDNGITLTVGGSVLIGHEIDGDDLAGDGIITTFGGPNNITQTANIGSNVAIDSLSIADDNTWTTSASIITDSSGSDIDLGAADGGETLNFNAGGEYSGEIDGNAGDTVNFGADGNGGDFVTGGRIQGVTVIVTSGSLQVNNTVGGGVAIGGLNIASGTAVSTQANITSGGALDLDGELTIGSGNTVLADTYVADANTGTVILEVSRALGVTDSGQLSISNGGPLDLSNDIFEVIVSSSTEGLIDETIANAVIGNTAATIGPGQFRDDSFFYDFELVANGNNLDLVITVNTIEDSVDTANNLAVANTILGNLAAIDSAALKSVQSTLGSASSKAEFNEVLESIQPTVDGSYAMASLNVKDEVNHAIHSRTRTLYQQREFPKKTKKMFSGSKDLLTGRVKRNAVAEVENEPKGSVWAHTFAKSATQSQKDGIDGYDLGTTGIVIGADSGNMRDDSMFGLTFVAAKSEADSNNANATTTDVETYGVSMFGASKVSAKTLISGSLNYAHNDNLSRRTRIGNIDGNNATADFSSQHIAFNGNLSQKYKTSGNWTITPSASIDYDYLFANSYTEDSNTDLAMNVDYRALNMLALGAGVDVDYLYKSLNGMRINPSAHAKLKYDVLNQGIKSTSSYLAAPSTQIITNGYEPQRVVLNLGTNVEAEITDKWRLAMGYDFELREEYNAHTGHINALRKF